MCFDFCSARLWRIFSRFPQNSSLETCFNSNANGRRIKNPELFHASAAQVLFLDNWLQAECLKQNHSLIYFWSQTIKTIGFWWIPCMGLLSAPLLFRKGKIYVKGFEWWMRCFEWMKHSNILIDSQATKFNSIHHRKNSANSLSAILISTCSCLNVIQRETLSRLSLTFPAKTLTEDSQSEVAPRVNNRGLLCSIDKLIWHANSRFCCRTADSRNHFAFIHSAPVTRENANFVLFLPISLSAAFRTSFIMTVSNHFHSTKFNEIFYEAASPTHSFAAYQFLFSKNIDLP